MLISRDSKARYWAILVTMGALLSPPVFAQEAPETQAQINELCGNLGAASEAILYAREVGMPMSEVMAHTDRDMVHMPEFGRQMVMQAYDLPNFTTEAMKDRQKVDFRNEIELQCFRLFD